MKTPQNPGFSKPNGSLEERFIEFACSFDGAEEIDKLELTDEQSAAQKADFFFLDRRVVCELKSLKTDTKPKIDEILEPYRDTEQWPVFYGSWDVSKVLAHLPEGEALSRRIVVAVSSAVQELIRKANRQIRSTKTHFNLPSAEGLLVIVNDLVEVVGPDLLVYRVTETLKKRTPQGDLQFPHIQCVCLFTETHFLDIDPSLRGIPGMVIDAGTSTGEALTFAESIQEKWAAFLGLPYMEVDASVIGEGRFKPWTELEDTDRSPITRSDLWRRNYRAHPYLRSLSDADLLNRGRQLLRVIAPMFLKNAPEVPDSRRFMIMIPWTHFLEEVNCRGVDMRALAPIAGWQPQDLSNVYEPRTREPEAGRFYCDPATAANYYCESVGDSQVVLYVVESYQPDTGFLVQARLHVNRRGQAWELLEVIGSGERDRLKEVYRFAMRDSPKPGKDP